MTDELNRTNPMPDGPGDAPAGPIDRAEAGEPVRVQPAANAPVEPIGEPAMGPVAETASAEVPSDGGVADASESAVSIPTDHIGEQDLPGIQSSEESEPAAAEQVAIGDDRPIVAEEATAAVEAPQSGAAPVKAKTPASSRRKAVEAEPKEEKPKSSNMDWYILKVQSNREESIKEGLLRRVAIAGLDYYFGDVIVPTEKVTEFKAGKKRVRKRKLYPGYLVVQMEINDDTWFLVRETPGIGDFTGAAGRPAPMLPHEVSRILAKQEEKSEKAPKLNISFRPGDQVKINEGTFENFEGQVQSIDEQNGRVTVMINIFGRSTPVELEYWQIGSV